MALSNIEKARWNASTTGIKGLGPILNEIYEAHDALVKQVTGPELIRPLVALVESLAARVTKLEAELTTQQIIVKK